MKILMVNKFLYPNGGSETYIFKLGKMLESMGHTVEFFGMKDERNIVGNSLDLYTSNKEFRSKMNLSKLLYPIEIIYSNSSRRKIAKILDTFKPDVVHMNNINFQITPSIIYEIKKRNIKIVWTLHDYQTICPNHSLYLYDKNEVCEKCINGNFTPCIKNKCLHGSTAKSVLATVEAYFYKTLKTYKYVDKIICPTLFLKKKVENYEALKDKCVTMHNFIDEKEPRKVEKANYCLYFGRFDKEKGISTLIEVCKQLPDINFIFAGSGELENELNDLPNVKNIGFVTGDELERLIKGSLFTIYPSMWYENCPFSIMESQMYGVPVIGANIGGIPELVEHNKTGLLFESGNVNKLKEAILNLYEDSDLREQMSENCLNIGYDTAKEYCEKLLEIYKNN